MKKKRGMLGVLIVLAILVLGIGYALSSTPLSISGTASTNVSDANFKVIFASATEGEKNNVDSRESSIPTATGSINEGSLTAKITVTNLILPGDSASVNYVVQNDSVGLDAQLALGTVTVTDASAAEYFSVEVTGADALVAAKEGTTSGTSTVNVKVTCVKTPTDNVTATITVPLTATAVTAE